MNSQVKNPAGTDITVWDEAEALRRLDGDEELLREVVGIFLQEIPGNLAKLSEAIKRGDLQTLEKTAHTLKGEMGYLGIPVLSFKAAELERIGRERELGDAAELFAAFETGISAAIDLMRGMKESQKQQAVAEGPSA